LIGGKSEKKREQLKHFPPDGFSLNKINRLGEKEFTSIFLEQRHIAPR
jgi:hypothetical protein